MRKKEERLVVTFHTTSEAIAMEEFCKSNQLPGRMIPVPLQISAGCGLAWSVPALEKESFMDRITEAGLEFDAWGVYVI